VNESDYAHLDANYEYGIAEARLALRGSSRAPRLPRRPSYPGRDYGSEGHLQAVAWHRRYCVRATLEMRFGSALWMKRVTTLLGPYRSTISESRS
jgi:hypothetical protein